MVFHRSVLLNESINALNINPNGIYIDGTFGLGGHSKLILSKLTAQGRLIATDRDQLSVDIGRLIMNKDKRFLIIHTKFSKMLKYIQDMHLIGSINGILLDLGICESQLSDATRGFSFLKNGPLDMRMDQSVGQTAANWLTYASSKQIAWVLKTFGEEKFSKKIAESIVFNRHQKPICTSMNLSKIVSGVIFRFCRKNFYHKHPATRSFLAIRIYINQELSEIKKFLQDALMILAPKGRLVIISFNSLEDRLIKSFIYNHSKITLDLPKLALTENQILNFNKNKFQLKKIITLKPTDQEIKHNNRARSAILRCAEKL